ncbi:hypothetical protein [uncultured Microbulbifer sp.]|uniref:PKD domain-containing protein n=1 Tax=uncultured Microbulbifer sp. TaxID=348147 RepID=UPI0026258C96|nr:hypothetical protein [uncultured Microbulbifer sp.]
MSIKNKRIGGLLVGTLSLVLAACGGGGGSGGGGEDETPGLTNQPPAISLTAISVQEGAAATLKASASDTDGSIASYSWEQKSGVSLQLSGVDTDTVSITAPAVAEDSEAILTLTVTDDDGASAMEDVTVTVLAQVVSVTVEGIVAGNSVANTQVTFSVGSQTFTTSSDASGEYAISIAIDDSLTSEMVRAEVTSSNTSLRLVSLMGDIQTLANAAGDDGVLTRAEHSPVVISSLTTALAAQLEQGEPGSIASQEALSAGKKLLSGSKVLHLGTLLKLVLEYSNSPDVVMPQSTPNTYALAADLEAASKLASDIQKSNIAIYQEALGALVADQNLVTPALSDISVIEDTYYLTSPSLNPAPFDGTERAHVGYRLKVGAEGNGELSGYLGANSISWVVTSAGLEIDGADFVVRTESNYHDGVGAMVEEELVVKPVLINWLDHTADIDWLLITAEQFTRYPNGEFPSTEPVRIIDTSFAIRDAGTIGIAESLQMGVALSIPVPALPGEVTDPSAESPDAYLDVESVQLIFAGSVDTGGSVTINIDSITGSGVASSTQVSSGWTVEDNGHLQIANVMGYPLTLVFLGGENQSSPLIFTEISDGAAKRSTIGKAYLKEAPAWSLSSAVGIYRYPLDFFTPLSPFWFEVNADGTALTISGWDQNSNGELTEDEFSVMPGQWKINEAGNLLIRRYFDPSFGFCQAETWDPAPSEDCVLYNEREWVVHQNMNGVGMRHYHRFFADPFLDRSAGVPAEHILNFGTIFNINFERVAERPFQISTM